MIQTGLRLDWHYRLPFDPPFLVPDCRSRRRMVPSDDKIRIIDHDDASKRPMSQTIDDAQIDWMRKTLVDRWRGGPGVFIALSTPLLLQDKFMTFMQKPEVAARAWAGAGDIASGTAVLIDSTKAGFGSNELLRVFRRAKDLEHMIRDKSWRDLWGLAAAMRQKGSPVKSMVLLSGDVHHSYCMTANLPGVGRPLPELVQITSSGVQTTIRGSKASWFAEKLGSLPFDVGKHRLVPGFMKKNDTGSPDLALYENAVAMVDVGLGGEVDVVVRHLAGRNAHVFRYTSGASYMNLKRGLPAVVARSSELELETEEPAPVSRQLASPIGVDERGLESPFFGAAVAGPGRGGRAGGRRSCRARIAVHRLRARSRGAGSRGRGIAVRRRGTARRRGRTPGRNRACRGRRGVHIPGTRNGSRLRAPDRGSARSHGRG